MEFRNLEDALAKVDTLLRGYGGCQSLWWYVVGEPQKRDAAAYALKESFDRNFTVLVNSNTLSAFETEIVDLVVYPAAMDFNQPVKNKIYGARFPFSGAPSKIYVPFFLNADKQTNLGQTLFDLSAPGVLSVSAQGYRATTNPSKRECFHAIFLK